MVSPRARRATEGPTPVWPELHGLLAHQAAPGDAVDELLAEERIRAERLLNRVRAAVLLLMGGAALLYAPRITRDLSVINVAILVPMIVWTIAQHALYHRQDRARSLRALGAINATVDVMALTLLQAGYGLVGSPELAVRSPIFLAYFAVLASRPFTGSARHAAAVTVLTASAYAALAASFIVSGRIPLFASPLDAVTGAGTSLLDEGAKVLLLATVGAIATYATAWNERALRRALAAQVAREAEARDVATRLQEADKLVAVGTLAAATVHEVRNPLTAIALQAELLLDTPLTEEQRHDVTTMVADARRTASFLTDLLRVARSAGADDTEVSSVPLTDVINSALNTARPLLREQQVALDISGIDPSATPVLEGSAPRLERAVLNLVMNAVQAMEGQARPKVLRIRVGTGSAAGTSAETEPRRNGANGASPGAITLDFEDTGPGFPVGAETQAFERFFTTKPPGRGTGLGLWIVRETVTAFGGSVHANRGAEGGALVRLAFPIPV